MTEEQESLTGEKIDHIPAKPAGNKDKKTTIGGQALIEGLMMVGPRRTAMAVRKADGSILVEEVAHDQRSVFFDKVPFIRGGIRLFRQLVKGTGALMRSAEFSEEETDKSLPESIIPEAGADKDAITDANSDEELASLSPEEREKVQLEKLAKEAREAAEPPRKEAKKSRLDDFLDNHMNVLVVFSAILGILFSVALFILLPRLIIDFIWHYIPDNQTDSIGVNLGLNLVEGVIRIAIFIGYLMLTSRLKDIARVWMYHGAEHKTIACYEAGEPLTVENIRKYSRFHPRCGTAFLFIVVIVSILVFSVAGVFIGVNIWWINALIRIALVPVVAGIAYEIIRFTGRHDTNPVCRAVSAPGLWMQRYTTKEPDDKMLEVAIAAMEAVIPEEKNEDTW